MTSNPGLRPSGYHDPQPLCKTLGVPWPKTLFLDPRGTMTQNSGSGHWVYHNPQPCMTQTLVQDSKGTMNAQQPHSSHRFTDNTTGQ